MIYLSVDIRGPILSPCMALSPQSGTQNLNTGLLYKESILLQSPALCAQPIITCLSIYSDNLGCVQFVVPLIFFSSLFMRYRHSKTSPFHWLKK
jgi:hypothetical protein